MLFGKYGFICTMEADAALPLFTGSAFRGAFGHSLKRVVCALKRERCDSCLLAERCVYALVFETPKRADESGPSPPHPFVLEPPSPLEHGFARGSGFELGLLLFGDATEYLPYFVYAVQRMGDAGIGPKTDGRRPRFVLDRVTFRDRTIYGSRDGRLHAPQPLELRLEAPRTEDFDRSSIIVSLETPLRFKYKNRLHDDLPFPVLIRAALRRVSALNNRYGDGEPRLDYKGLVRRAEDIKMTESDLRLVGLRRYSNRQKRTVSMSGLIGRVTYEGAVGEFLPLLRYCREAHLGKATAFGFGKIRVDVDEGSKAPL